MEANKQKTDEVLYDARESMKEYHSRPNVETLSEKIISPLELLLSEDPGNFEARKLLGVAYYGYSKDYPKSKIELEAAIKINPDSFECYTYLGKINMKLGNFESALMNFERSIDLKRDQPDVLLQMSRMNWFLGCNNKAIELLREVEFYAKANIDSFNDWDSYKSFKEEVSSFLNNRRRSLGYSESEFCDLTYEEALVSEVLCNFFEASPSKLERNIRELREKYFLQLSPNNSEAANRHLIEELKFVAKELKNPHEHQLDEAAIACRLASWLKKKKE